MTRHVYVRAQEKNVDVENGQQRHGAEREEEVVRKQAGAHRSTAISASAMSTTPSASMNTISVDVEICAWAVERRARVWWCRGRRAERGKRVQSMTGNASM